MGALDAVVERINRQMREMGAALDARPTLRSGTVTQINPIRIHLDGDPNPLPATPRTLVAVGPGDRVTVAHQKRSVTILGMVGRSQDTATGTQQGSGWTGYFEMTRVGRAAGILTGHFRRTNDSLTRGPTADFSGVGLNPNTVLPAWAHIVGNATGGTGAFPAAVSGGGINETIHLSISNSGAISMRTQTQIVFDPAVFVWLPPLMFRIGS